MSVREKINNILLLKLAKSKCHYLFAVPKRILFDRIHELSEKVTELEFRNEILRETITKADNQNNALKTQIEADTDIKYKLAYERLTQQYEDLTKENKGIKKTLDIVSGVIEKTESQNNKLKEQCKILSTQNLRLAAENKNYKEVKENKVVKHNFTKKVNANSVSLSK